MSHTRTLTLGVLAIAALAFVPSTTFAASSRVSCELTVTTPYDEVSFDKSEEVLVQKGDEVTIAWEGKNATDAVDGDKNEIDVEDSITVSPQKDVTYEYRFTNNSRKADCAVSLKVVDVSFDEDSLTTDSSKPTISGEANGTKTVRLEIMNDDGKRVFKSKNERVRGGEWNVRVKKSLKDGTYDVLLFGERGAELDLVGRSTLVIGEGGSSSAGTASTKMGGTLSLSSIPLLLGGNAAPGTAVPVAYIKVENMGSSASSIEGFTLKQNGSASTNAVVNVQTNDDKGGSRYTTSGIGLFKGDSVYVPLPNVI
ncbi:MAG: hypothetical protein Q8O19_00475, partial [Rectinemataceae bacterium]|nr:hypothetical protein [Rectinemataceae bacterium]